MPTDKPHHPLCHVEPLRNLHLGHIGFPIQPLDFENLLLGQTPLCHQYSFQNSATV